MRYLDAWLCLPDRLCHPMQRFIRRTDAVRYEELLAWNLHGEAGVEYELFYVEADRQPYRDALDGVESIREYSIAPIDDDSFHLYVCEETRSETTDWRGAFRGRELIVVPPIRYDADGVMGVSIVGDGEDIQQLLESMPAEITVTVTEIGTYDRRGGPLAGVLTDRQREAVSVALECGYYDVPRKAPLAAVADSLGIAQGSASVLLRRAERAVFSRLLERYGGSSRGPEDGNRSTG